MKKEERSLLKFLQAQGKEYGGDDGYIGSCIPCVADGGETEYRINREWFRQGYVFKSWTNYLNDPDAPCYAPETSDSVYTAKDFLDMCDGQQELADELFESVDWQHPESQMEDWMVADEWRVCPVCKRIIVTDGLDEVKCPTCHMMTDADGINFEGLKMLSTNDEIMFTDDGGLNAQMFLTDVQYAEFACRTDIQSDTGVAIGDLIHDDETTFNISVDFTPNNGVSATFFMQSDNYGYESYTIPLSEKEKDRLREELGFVAEHQGTTVEKLFAEAKE